MKILESVGQKNKVVVAKRSLMLRYLWERMNGLD